MLQVQDLRCSFDGFMAVAGVSLTVPQGSISAIIGPNGAGKTTLFNLITGHLRPDSGQVLFKGRDVTGIPPHDLCRVGMASSFQRTNIFPKLTVFQNVQAAFLSHRGPGWNLWTPVEHLYREQTEALLDSVGLLAKAGEVAGYLSHGNQKQLELGIALALEPEILLLDEPSEGLAPLVVEHMTEQIGRLKREGLTILLAEQNVEFALDLADRVYVLEKGLIRYEGSAREFREDESIRHQYLAL